MGGVVARLAFLPPPPTYDESWDKLTWVKTKRGQRIPLLYIPHPGAKFTILFAHANAEDLGSIADHLNTLAEVLCVNVCGFDYTGYGHASGTPSEQDCYADIAAALAWLAEVQNALPKHVILYGRSIGSGPVCELASKVEVAGVVLQSAFLSCIRQVRSFKRYSATCRPQAL
jgi:pimeloyl-ACP methyl ester carboxylesterase